MRRALSPGGGCVRRLRELAGHVADGAQPRRHHRHAGGAHPPARAGCRRRLRRALAGLSGVLRAHACGEDAWQAREVGRLALRDHRQRPPRTRGAVKRRARARARRALHRPAARLDLQLGRVSLAGGPDHQHRQPRVARHQRLSHPGALRPASARAHQHDADHCLPRSGAAECFLSAGAARGRGGARNRHRPHRASPAQLHRAGSLSVQDARRLHLRQRQSRRLSRRRTRARRLGRLRAPARGVRAPRQVARHRLRRVRRALGRLGRRPGAGGDQVRRVGQSRALCAFRAFGAGA